MRRVEYSDGARNYLTRPAHKELPALISYLGQFGGGQNVIPFWWDLVVVAGLSLAIYWLAMKVRLDPQRVRAYLRIGAATETAPGVEFE